MSKEQILAMLNDIEDKLTDYVLDGTLEAQSALLEAIHEAQDKITNAE